MTDLSTGFFSEPRWKNMLNSSKPFLKEHAQFPPYCKKFAQNRRKNKAKRTKKTSSTNKAKKGGGKKGLVAVSNPNKERAAGGFLLLLSGPPSPVIWQHQYPRLWPPPPPSAGGPLRGRIFGPGLGVTTAEYSCSLLMWACKCCRRRRRIFPLFIFHQKGGIGTSLSPSDL